MSIFLTRDRSICLQPVGQFEERTLDWLRPGRLALEKLAILDGDPGMGKYLLALDLCARCCRQAGKLIAVALLGLAGALFVPGTLVRLLSRSHRPSTELFRIVSGFCGRLDSPFLERRTTEELQVSNSSRIVCLSCKEVTVRAYSNVSLLSIDDAARVPDDPYRAVSLMLAVSGGRILCLSTPYGKRGIFYDAWAKGGTDWHRIEVPAERRRRIKPEVLVRERRLLGESWYRQEFCCSFEHAAGPTAVGQFRAGWGVRAVRRSPRAA